MGTATQKCLALNLLEPTLVKARALKETYTSFLSLVREADAMDGIRSKAELQRRLYGVFRARGVASQLCLEAI